MFALRTQRPPSICRRPGGPGLFLHTARMTDDAALNKAKGDQLLASVCGGSMHGWRQKATCLCPRMGPLAAICATSGNIDSRRRPSVRACARPSREDNIFSYARQDELTDGIRGITLLCVRFVMPFSYRDREAAQLERAPNLNFRLHRRM